MQQRIFFLKTLGNVVNVVYIKYNIQYISLYTVNKHIYTYNKYYI